MFERSAELERWMRETALGLVWPPVLGRVAAFAPAGWCAVAGWSSAIVLAGFSIVHGTSSLEPFRDMAGYLFEAAKIAVAFGAFAIVPVGFLFGGAGSLHVLLEAHHPRVLLAVLRALMLAPIAAVVPVAGMQFCAMVVEARDPACDFIRMKPAWIASGVFDLGTLVFGAGAALALVLGLFFGVRDAVRLAPYTRGCRACGYDLSGLGGGVCPECGSGYLRR